MSMVFALAMTHSYGVHAETTNFESETDAFPDPSKVHEDSDLLAELVSIGNQLEDDKISSGVDIYRWLFDISYLNSKYSSMYLSTEYGKSN